MLPTPSRGVKGGMIPAAARVRFEVHAQDVERLAEPRNQCFLGILMRPCHAKKSLLPFEDSARTEKTGFGKEGRVDPAIDGQATMSLVPPLGRGEMKIPSVHQAVNGPPSPRLAVGSLPGFHYNGYSISVELSILARLGLMG